MELLLALVVLAAVVLLIVGPLRGAARSTGAGEEPEQSDARSELEAAKEAKYREIRDAELDYRTGKLSHEDWRRLDSTLRTEALALLDQLEAGEEERQTHGG